MSIALDVIVSIAQESGWIEMAVEDAAPNEPNQLDLVYRERAQLVANLAAQHYSRLNAEENDPDWPVVLIELPTGQVSWHINKDDLHFFNGVLWNHDQNYGSERIHWDGHSTEEKYERLNLYTRSLLSIQAEEREDD